MPFTPPSPPQAGPWAASKYPPQLCARASLPALPPTRSPQLLLPPVPALLLLDFVFLVGPIRTVCGYYFPLVLILPLSLNAVSWGSLVSNSEPHGPIPSHPFNCIVFTVVDFPDARGKQGSSTAGFSCPECFLFHWSSGMFLLS